MATTTTTTTTTYQVDLAVYDLSHGMVRQLLGPNSGIDIVPHTGLVVYGREYFFGGGIQHQDPHEFRRSMGIQPVQIQSLGRTTVTQSGFEAWCQQCTRQGRFTISSYDLLANNCNNFCHAAAQEGLRLQGIPAWILDVPNRFMATPMGQMVRPMLENMQVGGGGGMAAPFASAPISSFPAAPTTTATPPTAMASNPWANFPSSSTAATRATKKASSTNDTAINGVDNKSTATKTVGTSLLDSFTKPLMSSDSKTAQFCIKKLTEHLNDNSQAQKILTDVGQCIAASNGNSNTQSASEIVEKACGVLYDIMTSDSSSVTTFALMLLRVLVVRHGTEDGNADASLKNCLDWIHDQLLVENRATTSLTGHAARSMAWLTIANAASSFLSLLSVDPLVEAALADLLVESQPRVEVRQAVAAFLYNVVLQMAKNDNQQKTNDELPDLEVSMLCACLEDVASEEDATTRLRRLLVAARIVQPYHTSSSKKPAQVNVAAKSLVNDLGFGDCIQGIATGSMGTSTTGNAEDGKRCKTLARELSSLLQ